jgi:hypothetical protein
MSADRLDVTVTYDASCGYIGSVPGLNAPVVALSLADCAARSRSRCCLMTFALCCSSTASPTGSATVGRRRRS